MGWGRMLLLGNLGQQMDIEDQRREIEELRNQLRQDARQRGDHVTMTMLAAENAELRLYLAALVRYMVAKGQIDPEEFEQLLEAVDAADGATDGGYTGNKCRSRS